MFLIFPGQLTYYEADAEKPWFYRWIAFDGGLCEALLGSAGLSVDNPVLTDDASRSAGEALKKIVDGGVTSYARLMRDFWNFAAALPQGRIPASNRHIRRAKKGCKSTFHLPL